MSQLPAVTGVTARYQGPGSSNYSTNYYYWVQALYVEGYSQLSAAGNTGAYCPSQLSSYAIVNVQWNAAPGAIGYILYRGTSSTAPANGASGIFLATSETGFKDDGTLATFTQVPRYDGLYVWKALYNFAVDGGAIGVIIPSISDTIPANAIVFGAIINAPTTIAPATGATISVGTSAGSGAATIIAATAALGGADAAPVNCIGFNYDAATQKAPFKMTAAGQIQLTIATDVVTAGVLEIFVFGVLPTNP